MPEHEFSLTLVFEYKNRICGFVLTHKNIGGYRSEKTTFGIFYTVTDLETMKNCCFYVHSKRNETMGNLNKFRYFSINI